MILTGSYSGARFFTPPPPDVNVHATMSILFSMHALNKGTIHALS